MKKCLKYTLPVLLLISAVLLIFGGKFLMSRFNSDERFSEVKSRIGDKILADLEEKGFKLGNPVFMRIFKEEQDFELWIQNGAKFQLFRTYKIANFSGELGPKLKEGDGQAPEGFYFVPKTMMNPKSSYHLSFNLGFPNKYDLEHGRTGSFLMVHGGTASIGCYAMTDPVIEEIYTIADAALENGQKFFRVHAFPFRMTAENLRRHNQSEWSSFWQNLKEGYDWFENTHNPPNVEVVQKRYVFSDRSIK